ncbi:hypothetical protein WKK05_10095 [Nostoc sp. UHCC 0302]|uniref:hypothetical protein n=1 Tax=Nostoc sp. UHCC 0302 TaxID=3134896 RepID=UPI00311CBE77
MSNYKLSIFIGLTTAVAAVVPLPAQAVSFNYDSAKNISARPIASNDKLFFFGTPSDNQGYTAFFNLNPNAPDRGHTENALNSPGNIAPYYTTGRDNSPEQPPSGATRSATLQSVTAGFSNFYNYLNSNNLPLSDIGFSYGQKSDRPFTSTWNLGEDKEGKNWFGGKKTTLEERIYTANPDDVELYLTYGNTKILNLGYTPFYSLLEYGATPLPADDSEAILTDPFSVSKANGLDSLTAGLADAFLKDVDSAGGALQIVYEDAQVEDVGFTTGNGFGVIRIRFPLSLNAVQKVPESSTILGLLMFGALITVSRLKKQKTIVARQFKEN